VESRTVTVLDISPCTILVVRCAQLCSLSAQLHSLFVPTILYIRPPPNRPNYTHGWSVQGPQKLVAHRSMSVTQRGMPIARRGTPEADILVQTERDRPAFHTITVILFHEYRELLNTGVPY